jgi:hypothetical protein
MEMGDSHGITTDREMGRGGEIMYLSPLASDCDMLSM